jgi:phage shock protein PspC (stress-responsive transcriptional regulator)
VSLFTILLGFSAFFVAACGAFFSVKGIGLLFSGSFYATVLMASSLEFGKIMATSFLYRYWNKINKLLKIYLTCAILVLMGITSLGVFGFLSQAFYSTKSDLDSIQSELTLLENKKSSLSSQISSNNERVQTLTDTRKNQENNLTKVLDQSITTTVNKSGGLFGKDTQEKVIDKKSVELKSKSLEGMQSNISSLESNIEKINNTNSSLLIEINTLDNSIISLNKQITKSDIGTYKFIAKAFNVDIETVVKWFILFIVIVFDPLAVSLVLAYNIASNRKSNETIVEKIVEVEKPIEKIIEKPIEILRNVYTNYKRGTKKVHNPDLADPNLECNLD